LETWGSDSQEGALAGEIWMNGDSIEAKNPKPVANKNKKKKQNQTYTTSFEHLEFC
jgi:hypothetical protein